MDDRQLIQQAEDVARFVRTLHSLWRQEPWGEVEPYAERAWLRTAGLGNNWPWAEVREFVREVWEPVES